MFPGKFAADTFNKKEEILEDDVAVLVSWQSMETLGDHEALGYSLETNSVVIIPITINLDSVDRKTFIEEYKIVRWMPFPYPPNGI